MGVKTWVYTKVMEGGGDKVGRGLQEGTVTDDEGEPPIVVDNINNMYCL